MGQALYRQYRPKSLAEVVGQEHITDTLLHALKQGKIAHAYLFTGPRGVGKTSIARILAHEINGLPYEDDAMHLDIIEIDAASNRRIDEIRDLRDKVNIAPSSATYKVYIIDEVHMLTREAFNALLKTLEEPPAHAVFILATTEAHKLPETIISRTQRFIFRPVSPEKVSGHLQTIASQEGITISDEALELIAAYGEGSFRDSISLLDQTRGHDGAVGADFVRSLIGIPTDEAIDTLCKALADANTTVLAQTLTTLRTQGFSAPQVAKHLAQRLRSQVLAGQGRADVFDLMSKLLEVPTAHNPDSFLELALLSYSLTGRLPAAPAPTPPPAVQSARVLGTPKPEAPNKDSASTGLPTLSIKTDAPQAPKVSAAATSDTVGSITRQSAAELPAEEPATTSGQPIAVDENLWPEILNSLKKSHNTLYGIVRMARPVFYEEVLELGFTFAFHKKRLSETKNKEVIIGVIKSLTGKDMSLKCVLVSKDSSESESEPATPAASAAPAPATTPDLSAISSIFGGAEVLDS